jgi:hypothetical protein
MQTAKTRSDKRACYGSRLLVRLDDRACIGCGEVVLQPKTRCVLERYYGDESVADDRVTDPIARSTEQLVCLSRFALFRKLKKYVV